MNKERICPNCRKPLALDMSLGLCPECRTKSGIPPISKLPGLPPAVAPGAMISAPAAGLNPQPGEQIHRTAGMKALKFFLPASVVVTIVAAAVAAWWYCHTGNMTMPPEPAAVQYWKTHGH